MASQRGSLLLAISGAVALALASFPLLVRAWTERSSVDQSISDLPAAEETTIGINLFGLDTFNRQQVFTNLIAQSEWFSSRGAGWTSMPPEQLDSLGWVTYLAEGQSAPRPLVIPPAPFRATTVRCLFEGRGRFIAGGVADLREHGPKSFSLDLEPTGAEGEGAWIELVESDPADPVRNIDCREADRPQQERFHPEFLSFLRGFRIIRFLDWQRINANAPASWSSRTLPESGSQSGAAGVSVEDMVDLANTIGADPWFLMPYRADDEYVRNFARLVKERLDPQRTVYVELGNEMWNNIFDAARQVEREGMLMGLGGGDRTRAQALRYAEAHEHVMRIWTEEFSDQPERLVRVVATQNANPDLAEIILAHGEVSRWTDALATAPYVWLEMGDFGPGDIDKVFAALPEATRNTIDLAARNRATAIRHGKRFIAYEGGQHLVTQDMQLAHDVQRDARMSNLYAEYIATWRERIGDALVLYATTAPISEYGSWGLREYAGQPIAEAPKLVAVRKAMDRNR